jgi:hypothetical protein
MRFNLIHRRAAECAENIYFMLAVERTASIKNNPPQTHEITHAQRSEDSTRYYCSKGVCFSLSALVHFPLLLSGAQQKVKRKVPLRSLRLERPVGRSSQSEA